MKKAAIEKAKKRLSLAHSHLEGVRQSKNFEQFQDCWYQFLVVANSAETVLQSGARSDSKSRPWFGNKINQRKNDPLLSYMHQARNVDEHGIEAVAEHVDGSLSIGLAGEAVHIKSLIFHEGRMHGEFYPVDGKLPSIKVEHPHVRLIQVIDDRFGDKFDPPTEHLGKTITDTSPYGIGVLWLRYLEKLTTEAEAMVIC